MTSLDSTQQGAEQPGEQPVQAPVPPGTNPAMTNVPGLPPTALSMQMQSMNEQYEQSQMQAMGAELTTGGPLMLDSPIPGAAGPVPLDTKTPDPQQFGQSSLRDMAEKMARQYGLNFSRGSLVDEQGNFQMTPDQLAQGGDLSDTAANMNRIAQAMNDQRIQMQQDKATAALQAGAGLLQKRGRGSLAALQSGFYQAMAANYTNPNLLPEQQDFSYWIQKDQMEEAELDRDEESVGGGTGGGGSASGSAGSSGAPIVSQPTFDNPLGSTDFGPQGKGDLVTSGPHAGQRPVYTYDPINKTTTISWENA